MGPEVLDREYRKDVSTAAITSVETTPKNMNQHILKANRSFSLGRIDNCGFVFLFFIALLTCSEVTKQLNDGQQWRLRNVRTATEFFVMGQPLPDKMYQVPSDNATYMPR